MKRNGLNLTLLGVFAMAAIGPGARAPAQPSTEGQWGPVLTWYLPAGHLIVLKNGKVLAFMAGLVIPTPCLLFDPATDSVTAEFNGPVAPNEHELFCTGHVALPDGRIFFTGSVPDKATTTLYDPDVDPPGPDSWIAQDFGPADRFYPTCTLLGDGTVLVTAGRIFSGEANIEADTPAIFDPSQPTGEVPSLQWRSLTSATYNDRMDEGCDPDADWHLDQYPFMFLLSTGDVVYAGTDESGNQLWSPRETRTLDVTAANPTWTDLDPQLQDFIWGGSAVMYRRDKIMKAGGRGTPLCGSAIASVFTLDAAVPNPAWTERPSMLNARKDHVYLLVLPDGKILATNGEATVGFALAPELFDPDDPAGVWKEMAPMQAGYSRAHHATAILLPDARVLVAGGSSSTAQIFSPPYLFQGPRPTITGGCSEPDTMCYGQTTSVMTPDANQVTAVSLIRPGGATHGFDFDQRFLDLSSTIVVVSPGEISVTAPATSNEAPPGHYMLYVLTGDAPSLVPSKGRFVLLSGGNGLDCNANGVPDDCDIAAGTSADCDCDGVPNECEGPIGACCPQPFGRCFDTHEDCCTVQGGLFFPGSSCQPFFACPGTNGPVPGP